MSRLERYALALIVTLSAVGVAVWFVARTNSRLDALLNIRRPIIISSAVMGNPDVDLRAIMDADPRTAVNGLYATGRPVAPHDAAYAFDQRIHQAFIMFPLGLSHFPGNPPRRNPLRSMRIWSGDQSDSDSFARYARPRTIQLIFYLQKIVDFDREYRLQEAPVYWTRREFKLEDSGGEQTVPLAFLDFNARIPESTGFPDNIYAVWVRMDILDYYGGSEYDRNIAVSEISFERDISSR